MNAVTPALPQRDRVTVGIDLGGTGTRLVALQHDGIIADERTISTAPAGTEPAAAVAQLIGQIRFVIAHRGLDGVGIGASGPVDSGGIIRNDDTLSAFSHIDLVDVLTRQLGVRCVIDNDAVTAAVGERHYGAAQLSSHLMMVTLGTGVGVAMLTGDGPVRAADGSHPEAGHLAVPGPPAPCYCGFATCWEQVASRTALDQMTGNRTAELAAVARAGDGDATALFHAYGQQVGVGLANLLGIYRPDQVVIGGGASRYLSLWERGLSAAIMRAGPFAWAPPLAQARLGALSGAVGAAVLARTD